MKCGATRYIRSVFGWRNILFMMNGISKAVCNIFIWAHVTGDEN